MGDRQAIFSLRDALVEVLSADERQEVLSDRVDLATFFAKEPGLAQKIEGLSPKNRYICHALIAIGQDHVLDTLFLENKVLSHLQQTEDFFFPCGGIVGYHCLGLELIGKEKAPSVKLLQPQGYDLRNKQLREEALFFGVEALESLAFLCPVGGAGDRFGLVDPKTGEPWPLARLKFLGNSLLERLIFDIVALERLYFEKCGRRIEIPIGLMTSDEKDNDTHVRVMLKESNYFGRPRTSFFIFKQPLVPVFDRQGDWICSEGGLHFKPGGHGMIWRLAALSGFFSELEKRGKEYLIIRQINNPLAGIDGGLLAFLGIGFSRNKTFGFAACPRAVGAKEGMNVVKQGGLHYSLTNIEYTDFAQYDLEDRPATEGGEYSVFPSNTNILFANRTAVVEAQKRLPFPGPIINFKDGDAARVELMMQNLADGMGETFTHPCRPDQLQRLHTFLTYNERLKTISVTKKRWQRGGDIKETPQGALFDWLLNMQELLKRCGFSLPALDKARFSEEGIAPFLFDYHPALGPLFSQIEKKLCGGSLSLGSHLFLNIADLQITNFNLSGSCTIKAPGLSGRCRLKDVTVQNEGEGLEIIIEPEGALIAENITIEGSRKIHVPAGEELVLSHENT